MKNIIKHFQAGAKQAESDLLDSPMLRLDEAAM